MPPSNKRVPNIRFSGFVEEWKEVTFASVIEIQASKEFIANPVEGRKYPVIQQGEEPIAGYSDKQPYKEFDSSILFGDHTLSLFKPNTPFLIATDGVKIFQAKEIDSNYLFHELLIKRPASQGYKRHLNILKGVALIISRNSTEQSLIGQFFRTLDKLIELRKKKLDKLIALKKELLNKLSPPARKKIPAIRFSGFVEEWKEAILFEIARYQSSHLKLSRDRFISTENIKQQCSGVELYFEKNIVEGVCFEKEDILVSNIRPYLKKAWFASFSGVCSPDVLAFHTEIVIPKYLYYVLTKDRFFMYMMEGVKGTKMPRGDKNHIMRFPVFFPIHAEQHKISSFFSTLDKLIELRKKGVDKLIALKKELLNKLFVG